MIGTPHGELHLPAFLPDATRGVVRALDGSDLEAAGIRGVMVNALHLSRTPGLSVIERAGGIHRFMGWPGPVMADSGGFQALSLGKRSKDLGSADDDGLTFRLAPGAKRIRLTPEDAIASQFRLGADLMICLDECTHPSDPFERQRTSVERTIAWARRCKAEFERRRAGGPGPKLFAVVQGGEDPALRRRCAEALAETGFSGYGFGGWPVDRRGALVPAVALTAGMLPAGAPKMGLGIGMPDNVAAAVRAGYSLFDCTLPTRDARHGRLFVMADPVKPLTDPKFFGFVRIEEEAHVRDPGPVDPGCDAACCRRYSRAYLRHLFDVKDALAPRLATLHNLRFFARFFARLSREA